ncbi:hypothetical protein BAC2_03445 [uncultured bacterium]|nr:hypothetical protein BAC2_03445 [uncultured bacterium]
MGYDGVMRTIPLAIAALVFLFLPRPTQAGDAATAPVPRIEFVVPLEKQPQESAKETIWYDNFDADKKYVEAQGGLEDGGLGGAGKCAVGLYEKDRQGLGNRKVFFGDSPYQPIARKGEKFDEIYWRVYVKHQVGWISGGDRGGPDKLSRATSIVSDKWNQAMFAHVWSSGDSLTLDNASGVKNGAVVTTKYNDFDNMKWVGGNKPVSKMQMFSGAEAGWWVCVEARARLNTPGKADAISQLWIDGRLECERKDFDWRGTYDKFGINAVFLETYWNKGSPVEQKRWYDNFVISTQPIGPMVVSRAPEIAKMALEGIKDWELEIASDAEGKEVVWRSRSLGGKERIKVSASTGKFENGAAKTKELAGGKVYWCRARQKGDKTEWSQWSAWHQTFKTEE